MKYIKTFETKNKIIDQILNKVCEYTYDEMEIDKSLLDDFDIDDFPFKNEFAIIYQKDYISNIYDNEEFYNNIDLNKFTKIYNNLLESSKDIIISSLKRNPSLYTEWKFLLDECNLQIPEWIKSAYKYNL